MATLADCNSKISELFYVLKAELKSLRNGDMHLFGQFAAEKTEKLGQLNALVAELGEPTLLRALEPQFARLQKLSTENGVMLKSVYNGIKSAHDRVQKIKSQSAQVGAYGRAGGNLYFHEQASGREMSF